MADLLAKQTKLFGLMADFTADTIVGFISNNYKTYSVILRSQHVLTSILAPFAEYYFNYCALRLYDRTDTYINDKFDEMMLITLDRNNHPIDLLQTILRLTMDVIGELDISGVISNNYKMTMDAVSVHVRAVINRHKGKIPLLRGCNHIHDVLGENEKLFTFSMGQYIETEKGRVKLSTI